MSRADKDIFLQLSEEGTKRFSKIKKEDRIHYGKEFGQKSLLAFARYIDPKFQNPKHIKTIIDLLEDMEKGKILRAIVNMPPRHGKSQICTRIFPTWYLGKHPETEVIIASYSNKKAERFTGWIRDRIEAPAFSAVFPDVAVRDDVRARSDWQTTAGGVVIGAGLSGGLTGEGAGLLIIDDPYKNMEEATSETMNEKIWENYLSVAEARLAPDARVLIVHTRWTKNDLTGRLLGEDKDDLL